jgi:hypothetical protein
MTGMTEWNGNGKGMDSRLRGNDGKGRNDGKEGHV